MNQYTNKTNLTDKRYFAPICKVFNISPEFEILQTSGGGTGGTVPDPDDGGDD